MKSDIIRIDNQGSGFQDALAETAKAAQYRELNHKEALQLQLCTEEMLSLARSVTGELEATFWLESEGRHYELHLSTKTVMDREKRNHLLASASSRKNEAAGTFLGKLRDAWRPWFPTSTTASPTSQWTIWSTATSRSPSGTSTSSRSCTGSPTR